jgi:peptidyl-prolyl cis-trans isomerase SurA
MRSAAVVAIVVLAAASAGADRAPVGAIAIVDRPVAIVDGTPIWQSQFDEHLALVSRDKKQQPDHETLAALLETLIDDQLFLAKVGPIEITDAELDAAVAEIRAQNGITDAELDAALAAQGFTRAQYRVELARQVRIFRAQQQVLASRVTITDDDLKREYAERKAADPTLGSFDSVREPIRNVVYAKKMEAARVDWVANRRKHARIERRLP